MMSRGLARTYKSTVRLVPYYSSIYFAKVSSYCKVFVSFMLSIRTFYLFRAKLSAFNKYFACRNCIQPALFTKNHGVDAGAYSISHIEHEVPLTNVHIKTRRHDPRMFYFAA